MAGISGRLVLAAIVTVLVVGCSFRAEHKFEGKKSTIIEIEIVERDGGG